MWTSRKTHQLLAGVVLLAGTISNTAFGGSNSGDLSASASFSCDNRADLKKDFQTWCTVENAQAIRSQCYPVVHMNSGVQRCGWQGCGFFSLVGQKPTLNGDMVVEYGLSTPHGLTDIPASWQRSGNSVLPQPPFPRNYLTVDQFMAARKNCGPGGASKSTLDPAVLDRICSMDEQSLELSPYYVCLKAQKIFP